LYKAKTSSTEIREANRSLRGREWKLRWFLGDFGYDADLLAAEELDGRRVVGLEGVIRLAYWGADGHRRLDVQGFAPAERWAGLCRESQPVSAAAPGATA